MGAAGRARIASGIFFFANGAVVGAWVPFIPERARALALSPGSLGRVLLGAGVGAMMVMPIVGRLTARLGSRAVSMVCALGFAAVLCLNVWAPSAALLLPSLILFGMCGAGMDVAMNTQAVLVEERSGQRTLSLLHGLFSLGNVVGSLVVSAAFARGLPMRPLAVAVAVSLAVATTASSRWMLPQGSAHADAVRPRSVFTRRILWLGALVLAAMVSEGGTADWSGLYLRNARGLGPGWAGVGFGVFAALMLLGRFVGDTLAAKLGEVRLLRLGGVLSVLGALLVVYGPGTAGAMVGFALFGAGLANVSPVLYRTAGQSPGLPPGVGLASAVGLGYVGLLAGPPLLGEVGQAFGLPAIFLVLAVLGLVLGLNARIGRGASSPAR